MLRLREQYTLIKADKERIKRLQENLQNLKKKVNTEISDFAWIDKVLEWMSFCKGFRKNFVSLGWAWPLTIMSGTTAGLIYENFKATSSQVVAKEIQGKHICQCLCSAPSPVQVTVIGVLILLIMIGLSVKTCKQRP